MRTENLFEIAVSNTPVDGPAKVNFGWVALYHMTWPDTYTDSILSLPLMILFHESVRPIVYE
jgi:hypothetical protein